jgi:hypothetical protein
MTFWILMDFSVISQSGLRNNGFLHKVWEIQIFVLKMQPKVKMS